MLNKAVLIGRLTKDPEMRTVNNDVLVANFTLAVNRPKYGESEQKADFISIVAWRKTAAFVEKYFKKGMQVYVVGRIQTHSWEADDGTKRYATDIVADEVGFAESKRNHEENGNGGGDGFDPFPADIDDDLPF
jgi:single-strand DNA-binding protein